METNGNRPPTEREQTAHGSSTADRRPPKFRRRSSVSRTISDEEFVRAVARRTGRSHERWLPLLAAARAARSPVTLPPRASSSRPLPEPAPRPRTAGDLEDLLAALREGPVELGAWHRERGLSMPEAYKSVLALRRLGHRIKREGRSEASKYRLTP
jgi:hypothetical protein